MPYTMEDYQRDVARRYLEQLPHDELLQRLSPEERVKGLSLEERLKGLSPEEIREYLEKLKSSQHQHQSKN